MKTTLGYGPPRGVRPRLPDARRHLHPRLHPRRRPRRRPRPGARLPRRRRRDVALNVGTGVGRACSRSSRRSSASPVAPVPHEIAERRPGDPVATYADPALIRDDVGLEVDEVARRHRRHRMAVAQPAPPTAMTAKEPSGGGGGGGGRGCEARPTDVDRVGDRRTQRWRDGLDPADHSGRRPATRRVPRPPVARQPLSPILLAEAALTPAELEHSPLRLRRPGLPRRRSHGEFIGGRATPVGQLATTPTPRSWSTTPTTARHRDAVARTPRRDRQLQPHRAVHRRGAR